MKKRKRIFIVAGEASADTHAANLLKELREMDSSIDAYGIGGPRLAEQGMKVGVDASGLNVVGLSEWMDKAKEIYGIYRGVVNDLKANPPDLALLLDLPDFNLMMAKKLKALGVPVVYYISPQVWAWRRYRIKKIKKLVDKMLVVFPFEKNFYQKHGVEVSFVGHPLLEKIAARGGQRTADAIKHSPRIALLPGSRTSEIRFHAETLSETAFKLKERFPTAEFKLPVAVTLKKEFVREKFPSFVNVTEEDSLSVLRWADVAAVASGTATLETALIGTPFCLYYRASRTFQIVTSLFARYQFVGMPNILAQKEIVKELLQDNFTPETVAAELSRLIEDELYRNKVATDLQQCRTILAGSELGRGRGVSREAARQVFNVLNQKGAPASVTGLAPSPA